MQRKTKNVDLKLCIECVFNLFGFSAFYFILLLVTSSKVQNVSRRLCNASFIFFTVNIYSSVFEFKKFFKNNIVSALLKVNDEFFVAGFVHDHYFADSKNVSQC